MRIAILHETITEHDAVGNDIRGMYEVLSSEHYCRVYGRNRLNRHVKYLDKDELETICADKNAVLIYHHSGYWEEGYQILKLTKGKIIIRYHNITPEHFFHGYSQEFYQTCRRGRQQTMILQREFPEAYWIADSMYNTLDLTEMKKERIGVCAPFHQIERWGSGIPDEGILRDLLESKSFNILFVGRIVPNKGYLKILKIIRYYREIYDDQIKMRFIGKFDENLERYNQEIKSYIERYEMDSQVELIGEINDQTLMSYYLGSDVLLCCSEHEGFCVPVIEAQYFGLPVIALNSCAVPETLGEEQLILDDDIYLFTAALHLLHTRPEYRKLLRKEGRENYQKRFTIDLIRKKFQEEFRKGCK